MTSSCSFSVIIIGQTHIKYLGVLTVLSLLYTANNLSCITKAWDRLNSWYRDRKIMTVFANRARDLVNLISGVWSHLLMGIQFESSVSIF